MGVSVVLAGSVMAVARNGLMRREPFEPCVVVGGVEIEQGHNDAAIDEIHKAIEAGYRPFIPYAVLAAAYALEGKMDKAKSPWRKPVASIPISRSNGLSRIRRTCRRL